MSDLDFIPAARRDAVRAALSTAFGASNADAFHPLAGGVSGALIHRFEVNGRLYALRLEPDRIAILDRRRHFDCMTTAADVGAAPPVRYVDAESGVAIMDFIGGQPLTAHLGGATGLARALGQLTARLRSAPPFPSMGDYPDVIATLLDHLDKGGLFAPGELAPHAEGLARVRRLLDWGSAPMAAAHNDPNPRNLLFDGERLWLIDWELAASNDPLADLAILSTELAAGPEAETALLEGAFGNSPDDRLLARLHVMRLLTRLFYGCIVLENFIPPPGSPPDTLAAYTPTEFRTAVADGALTSGSQSAAYAFGKMSLAAFLAGLRSSAFENRARRLGHG